MQDRCNSPGTPQRAADPPREAQIDPPWDGVERRGRERRSRPTQPWKDLLSPLRRAKGRRASDRKGYVDRYSKQDVVLLLVIFGLNVADAFMTMLWLHRGGREANPVMAFLLDIGPAAFLAQKCLVVGFWLILLLVHKNFRFAKIGLYASLAVYSLLLIVHFGIVFLGIEPPRRDPVDETAASEFRSVPSRDELPMTPIVVIGAAPSELSRTDGPPAAE